MVNEELSGKPNKLRGSDLRWASIPSRGSRNTPSRPLHATETGISSGRYESVGPKASLYYRCTQNSIELFRSQVFSLFIYFFRSQKLFERDDVLVCFTQCFCSIPSRKSSNCISKGTKGEAEAMVSKHKLRAGAYFKTALLGIHLTAFPSD